MAAPESTKFQVNFKSPDGTLINLYATNKEELEALLTAAQDFSALIGAVSQSFGGVASAAPVQSGPRSAAVAPTPAAGGAPSCAHGVMSYKEGTNAQGRAWKGYLCNAPKGATKCQAIWV